MKNELMNTHKGNGTYPLTEKKLTTQPPSYPWGGKRMPKEIKVRQSTIKLTKYTVEQGDQEWQLCPGRWEAGTARSR